MAFLFILFRASKRPSARRAKSSRLRASPRTEGCRPAAWIPASSLALISSVLPKRLVKLFQSVLRRWTKLALLTEKKKSSSLTVTAGFSRRYHLEDGRVDVWCWHKDGARHDKGYLSSHIVLDCNG